MVAVSKTRKPVNFQGTKIHFFKTKHLWGYRKQRYMGFDVFVAEKEKCIIDSLILRNVHFDEVAKAIPHPAVKVIAIATDCGLAAASTWLTEKDWPNS